jgi:hypothetical protein
VVLVPGRMQLDVAGNATGRPRPLVIGPGEVEIDQLDPLERSILAQLVGAATVGETGLPEPLERRSIARVVGPTPPRRGVIHPATSAQASSTSGMSLRPSPNVMPALTTAAPGLTMSGVTIDGAPAAATMMSAVRV